MSKRVIIFLSIFTLLLSITSEAEGQIRLGVKGGLNFSALSDIDIQSLNGTINKSTAYHAGIALQVKVPLIGLAIQPELLYSSRRAMVDYAPQDAPKTDVDLRMDYLELPVNLQVGLDLILLRPYLQISPFVGYIVSQKIEGSTDSFPKIDWKDLNRFNYGLGIGGGIDIWKLQVSFKYNWSFGSIGDMDSLSETFEAERIMNGKFNGVELSLAYFF